MSEAFFYRVADSGLHDHIRRLLERTHASGWRAAVRARSEEEIKILDRRLWISPGESFLPHGTAGGLFDADQPILLTTDRESGNRPDALIIFDGAEFDDAEISSSRRTSIVFRSGHEDEMRISRQQWSRLAKAGVRIQYWAFESGKWKCEAKNNYPQP